MLCAFLSRRYVTPQVSKDYLMVNDNSSVSKTCTFLEDFYQTDADGALFCFNAHSESCSSQECKRLHLAGGWSVASMSRRLFCFQFQELTLE